jgi:photosystem II stability/assembly factor-like uncharacterized protein
MNKWFLILIVLTPTLSRGQNGWYSLPEKFPAYDQVDAFFMNADTGFVACVNSGLFKTIDGGHNWTKIQSSGNYPRIRYFANNKVMFQIPGRAGATLRSIDSGSTWETLDLPALGDIDFPTPSVGYAIGSNLRESSEDTVLYCYMTSDSGKTWLQTRVLGSETLIAGKRIKFRDELHGMLFYSRWTTPYPDFAAQGHILLYTSDGGKNWAHLDFTTDVPTKISFVNDRWICGHRGLYSSDEGAHWNQPQIFSPTTKILHAQYFSTSESDTIYVTYDANFAKVFRSTDAGKSYFELKVPVFDLGNIYDPQGICDKISTPLSNVGYIIGRSDDTLIYKTTDAGGPSLSVRLELAPHPYVCPNPSNDYVNFETESQPAAKRLDVYTSIGHKVLSLEIPAMTTYYNLDVSKLASGIYTAKMTDKVFRFIKE